MRIREERFESIQTYVFYSVTTVAMYMQVISNQERRLSTRFIFFFGWVGGGGGVLKYCAFYLLAFDFDAHFTLASGTHCAGEIRQKVGHKCVGRVAQSV